MALQFIWTDYSEPADSSAFLNNARFEPLLSEASLDIKNGQPAHVLIQGDNYPVLKMLGAADKPYVTADNHEAEDAPHSLNLSGQVDFIYIDPPYNTGNDFTYKDDFSVKEMKAGGADFMANDRSVVDKHSSWLSFMQRRLSAARALLKESGCIFIAIDQSELYTLKLLCDQIFGEENFVNDFMWLHGKGKKDRWSRTLQQHTLCYAFDKKNLTAFRETEKTGWAKTNADNDSRGNWFSGSISFTEKRSNPNHKNYYSIVSPSGKVWTRQWQTDEKHMKELIADNRIFWGLAPAYDKVPRVKIFNEDETEVIPRNIIEPQETTRSAQHHLDHLLGAKGVFDNPKPVSLIKHLIQISRLPPDALVMDFFAGSGTTFEAVCQLNAEEGTKRRCILVQKEEPVRTQAKSQPAPFNTISDLCWERCRRTAEEYGAEITRHLLML